jgi:uncharacterized protein involved in exopolysaccharide biosynthesis
VNKSSGYSPAHAELLSVREILSIFFEQKWNVLTVFFGVVFTTIFLVYFVMSPSYEAKAKIVLNLNDLTGPLLSAGNFVSDLEKLTDFQTQKDIINSVIFSESVVDKLDLQHTRNLSRLEIFKIYLKGIQRNLGELLGIESWKKPYDPRAAAIEAVNSNFILDSKPESRAFELSYRAGDPVEAERTLNNLIEEYIQYNQNSLNQRAAGLIEYLEQQSERVGKQLSEAEQSMLEFRKKDLVNHSAVDSQLKASFAGIADSTEVQDEIKIYILKMEEELRNLKARFTLDDPKIVELQEKISSYVEAINSMPDKELELLRLQRAIELHQEIYLLMEKNLEQIKVVAIGQTAKLSRISVIEPAAADDTPVAPKKKLLILLGIMMGGVLGITWAFLLNYLDHTIGSVRDIGNYLRLRNLGHLPEYKKS